MLKTPMHLRPRPLFLLLILFLLPFSVLAQAEDVERSAQPAMSAYACTINPDSGQADIRVALNGADGAALPADGWTPQVTRTGGEQALPAESVTGAPVETRPPARIILVLDITSTMPIDELRNSLISENGLFSQLQFDDQLALLAVGAQIAPLTDFYNDKNALYNEHLADLEPQEGNNRLFDGIAAAVEAMQPNSPQRQIVLVITDSRRGQQTQTPSADIITRAQASKTQIYTIGIRTNDNNPETDPDQADLFNLANSTRGFGWNFSNERTRAAAVTAAETALNEFVTLINGEAVISVNMTGLEPDETGLVPFDVTLNLTAGGLVTDRISCPVPTIEGGNVIPPENQFTVAFANVVEGTTLRENLDVEIGVQPELPPPDTVFRFFLDDDEALDTPEGIFPLDVTALQPGTHTLRAQLRDGSGNVLATTPTITVNVQGSLALSTANDAVANLSGPVTIVASNASPNMGRVFFRAAQSNNPSVSFPIGDAPVENETATLQIDSIETLARNLFPPPEGEEPTGWNLIVTARAPGADEDAPLLADSDELVLSVAPPAPPPPEAPLMNPILPIVASVILLVIIVLLLRVIGTARITRLISSADDRDMGSQLMSVTVNRGGNKQTYVLTKKTNFVGRGSGNDISLEDDANVSRQHGVIMWRGEKWYYANRKAKVKTKVNGKPLRGIAMVRLDNPSDIEIGGFQVVFHSNAQRGELSDLVKTNL